MNDPNWWPEWSRERLARRLKEAERTRLVRSVQGSNVGVAVMPKWLGRWAVGATFWVKHMVYQESPRVELYPYPPFK